MNLPELMSTEKENLQPARTSFPWVAFIPFLPKQLCVDFEETQAKTAWRPVIVLRGRDDLR